ncbi:hypothetical protein ACE41F_26920 [Bacillus cereus]|uniref:hypothetical protein n=1 Tax=Bacillus cereus TaxID=1396 RepID=UPI0035CCA07F
MANIAEATEYINAYVISNEDWNEADEDKQTRLLNAAERTLRDKYGKQVETIPDEAVFEFAGHLAIVFNDTNKMQQQGIASFSVTGVGSFTFKENNVSSAVGQPLDELIPASALSLIEQANDGIKLTGRNVGWLI